MLLSLWMEWQSIYLLLHFPTDRSDCSVSAVFSLCPILSVRPEAVGTVCRCRMETLVVGESKFGVEISCQQCPRSPWELIYRSTSPTRQNCVGLAGRVDDFFLFKVRRLSQAEAALFAFFSSDWDHWPFSLKKCVALSSYRRAFRLWLDYLLVSRIVTRSVDSKAIPDRPCGLLFLWFRLEANQSICLAKCFLCDFLSSSWSCVLRWW